MALDIQKIQKLIQTEVENLDLNKKPAELYDPIRYILSLGGKRLRPALTLIGHYLFAENIEQSLPAAKAVEIFHNFSLVHDDIMDKAPLRRGKDTVHKKWNENIAILSGDVMLVQAYEQLLELSPNIANTVMRKFSTCATEVCEGQQFDMNFETLDTVTEAEYLNMIKLKTAVLLGFSLEAGALIANASIDDADLLRQFGTSIGVGFQLKDDLLDVFGEQAKVGKQVGGDIISNKKTYLLIQALNNANPAQLKELQKWIEAKEFDVSAKVTAVTELYLDMGIKAISENKMNEQFNLGFEYLEKVNCDSNKKKELIDFSYSLINREK